MSFVLAASDVSFTTLLPRLFLSMIAVIAVMWVAARVMKNRQIPGSGGSMLKFGPTPKRSLLQVLARQGVGRHASVTIVRAGEKALVLGITETNISLLAELEAADLNEVDLAQVQDLLEPHGTGASPEASSLATGSARTGLLTQIRERTVRKV